ncbi:MAG: hypothetical protein U0K90_04260 [Bacteroidales bacterium]|nr:hypothetical protein [Bacteroidales bacterium]
MVFTALFVGFEKLNAQDVSKFKCLKTLKGHSRYVVPLRLALMEKELFLPLTIIQLKFGIQRVENA